MVRVLMVCLGNICRSPTAEATFRIAAKELGLAADVDSAGTGAWHVGEPADSRSRAAAAKHGVQLTSIARQVTAADVEAFDLLVAMDRKNQANLHDLAETTSHDARIVLLRDFDPTPEDGDVPDPYLGEGGFDLVFEICRRSTTVLAERLRDGSGSFG